MRLALSELKPGPMAALRLLWPSRPASGSHAASQLSPKRWGRPTGPASGAEAFVGRFVLRAGIRNKTEANTQRITSTFHRGQGSRGTSLVQRVSPFASAGPGCGGPSGSAVLLKGSATTSVAPLAGARDAWTMRAAELLGVAMSWVLSAMEPRAAGNASRAPALLAESMGATLLCRSESASCNGSTQSCETANGSATASGRNLAMLPVSRSSSIRVVVMRCQEDDSGGG
mmetsp:Transcript_36158/g.114985  ORF Transcript_36158/g.114985 Transcript_36158/m.114985 type:complete len:229 (+) Transcript_36158:127-813(+)